MVVIVSRATLSIGCPTISQVVETVEHGERGQAGCIGIDDVAGDVGGQQAAAVAIQTSRRKQNSEATMPSAIRKASGM